MINGSNIRLPNGQFSTLVTPVDSSGSVTSLPSQIRLLNGQTALLVYPVDVDGNPVSGGGSLTLSNFRISADGTQFLYDATATVSGLTGTLFNTEGGNRTLTHVSSGVASISGNAVLASDTGITVTIATATQITADLAVTQPVTNNSTITGIAPDEVAGLQGWFTAYDNTYLQAATNGTGGAVADGEGVGRWVARAGTGIAFIPANGVNKPTYLAGKGINTWWRTDGGTTQSSFTRSGLSGVGTTQAFSYIALLWTSGGKAGAMIDLNSTAIGILNGVLGGVSPARNAYAFINASASPPSGAIARKTARYLTLGLSASASGINIWINETKYTLASPATLANITSLFLGTSAGGNPIPHRFYECAFFNSALDDATMNGLLTRLRAQTVTMSATNQVCIVGDSMSEGVGAETGQPYHWQLTNKPSYQWHTYAIDGGFLFTATPITAATLDTFKLAGDNIAIVWMGTNDINGANRTEAQFIANLSDYCNTLKTSGWKVIVCTLQDFPNNEATRLAVNTSIRTNFATYATAVADLGANANLSDCTNTTYFTSDQVHLKDAGHQVVASIIDAVLGGI